MNVLTRLLQWDSPSSPSKSGMHVEGDLDCPLEGSFISLAQSKVMLIIDLLNNFHPQVFIHRIGSILIPAHLCFFRTAHTSFFLGS